MSYETRMHLYEEGDKRNSYIIYTQVISIIITQYEFHYIIVLNGSTGE